MIPPPLSGGRLLDVGAQEFRSNFNVKSFMFEHSLANHPLFELPRLAAVAERMLVQGDLTKFVALGGKSTTPGTKFSDMPPQERLAQTIRQLADAGAWLKITGAQAADADYRRLLQDLLGELEELSGFPLRRHITWSSLTVFLASPGIVTPYHMDHESNFLFQVKGEKDISLFDPTDRELLSDDEIERFYVGDFEAARYRKELQSRGAVYRLTPGKVVHHPPLAPHWVQNGNDVSVSVSIGFCLRALDRRARVYQVNHYLRKFGFGPTPPGRSMLRDRLKIAGVGMLCKSNPTTPDEILFSGLSRLAAPTRFVKRLLRGASGSP